MAVALKACNSASAVVSSLAAVPSRRLVPRRVNAFLELLSAGAQP